VRLRHAPIATERGGRRRLVGPGVGEEEPQLVADGERANQVAQALDLYDLSEFRCAEADASGALSFAIVVTPTVDVSCDDVAGLKFEAGCAAACASCSSADAPKMCAKGVCAAFEKPDIAVDPFSRTDAVSNELPAVPQMKTITFGTDV
jgi:hypothetical protein